MSRSALLLIFAATLPLYAQPPTPPGVTVSPSTNSFTFQNHDFGPKSEEFDPKTQVWTVRFRSDGIDHPHATSTPPEEFLINFYGWNPPTDPEAYAAAYIAPRPNLRILGKFQAPDALTKRPGFFILSETIYPGEPDAFVNITEVTSIGTGAYAITYSHFVPGENAERRGVEWYLSPEGKAVVAAIGHIGVDSAWQQHLVWPKSTP